MAQCFREFRDLTSDHESFPDENFAIWWAWLRAVHRSARAGAAASEHDGFVNVEASDARLIFETGHLV